MAYIIGIAIKENKRFPMQELSFVEVSEENGLHGDFRGTGGFGRKRQVTILSIQQWERACSTIGVLLPWHTRRANLCVDGLTFGPQDVGKKLLVGTVTLEITGETEPCKRMDEAVSGLRATLSQEWRGGVTCRVIKGGIIKIKDPVVFI